MLTIHGLIDSRLITAAISSAPPPEGRAVWFDLLEPDEEEDRLVEEMLGVAVPTRDEMQEIEASSRLYEEDGALYMTALVPFLFETDDPRVTPITFVLAGDRLVTVRYDRPRSFDIFRARAERPVAGLVDGRSVLIGLLETIIGRMGGAIARAEESIVSLSRLFHYLGEENGRERLDRDGKARLATLELDARSLAEHAKSLDARVNFLLTATLGLVGLEQNTIVKIFSVLAVVFMPPMLIASIYGMNFHFMPELDEAWGYPMAIALMVASVATTFAVFKWKRWL